MTSNSAFPKTIGFIGLGVMGEPMCRNLAVRRQDIGQPRVLAFDLNPEPLARLSKDGVENSPTIGELARQSDVILMSLPGGPQVEAVSTGDDGLAGNVRPGSVIIDLSTTQVSLTRSLSERFAADEIDFMDAPVARTRQAAELGTLAIMVGGVEQTFAKIEPILRCFATDVLYCGGSGNGQMVKILNNMVLFQTVSALAEALTVAQQSGLEGETLFKALANGSADSFALRNHGMNALLPSQFPEQAFSTLYAAKDLDYALDLAESAGVAIPGAENVRRLFENASELGYGDNYWPVLLKVLER